LVHKLLVRQFELSEKERFRLFSPKPVNYYDENLHQDAGILGSVHLKNEHAILFDRRTGVDPVKVLRATKEYVVEEISRKGKGLDASPIMRGRKMLPTGATYEFHLYDPDKVGEIPAGAKTVSEAIQVHRQKLAELELDLRMFSRSNPRLRANPKELLNKIKALKKSISGVKSEINRLDSLKPALTVVAQGHVISLKGDWRRALSVLEEPLKL